MDRSRPNKRNHITAASGLRGFAAALAGAVILAFPISSGAAGWSVRPGLLLSEGYTNNLFLSPSGGEEELLTIISPSVALNYKSGQSDLNVGYSYVEQVFARNNDFNDRYSELRSSLSSWFFNQRLGLAAGAEHRPVVISARSATPLAVVSRGNYDEVTDAHFSPRLIYRSALLVGEASGKAGRANYDKQDTLDRDERQAQLHLESSRDTGRAIFGADYSRQYTDFTSVANNTIDSVKAQGTLGARFGQEFSLSAIKGYERNDYSLLRNGLSGKFWFLNARWAPSANTAVDVSWGRRYYGRSYSGRLTHTGRKLHLQGTYQEEVSTAAQSTTAGSLAAGSAGPGSFEDYFSRTNQLFLDKRLISELSLGHEERRLTLRGLAARRTYQLTGLQERNYEASLGYSHRLGRRTTVDAVLTGRRFYSWSTGIRDDYVIKRLALTRHLPRDSEILAEVRQTRRNSDPVNTDYEEFGIRLAAQLYFGRPAGQPGQLPPAGEGTDGGER